jgi:hypothetical protein
MTGREWTVENGRPRRSLVVLANASIQAATTLQGLPLCAALDGSPSQAADSSCPRGWIPLSRSAFAVRFRGYDACWLGRSMQQSFQDAP